MKYIRMMIFLALMMPATAYAVTMAEDIATTILLRGYDCGGKQVSAVSESEDGKGNKTILATCPNGKRYKINVSYDGRVVVTPR
jgi:energy-coupling factor transporter transmembrane protein EcfT